MRELIPTAHAQAFGKPARETIRTRRVNSASDCAAERGADGAARHPYPPGADVVPYVAACVEALAAGCGSAGLPRSAGELRIYGTMHGLTLSQCTA